MKVPESARSSIVNSYIYLCSMAHDRVGPVERVAFTGLDTGHGQVLKYKKLIIQEPTPVTLG